jgi:hypothetical protein
MDQTIRESRGLDGPHIALVLAQLGLEMKKEGAQRHGEEEAREDPNQQDLLVAHKLLELSMMSPPMMKHGSSNQMRGTRRVRQAAQ